MLIERLFSGDTRERHGSFLLIFSVALVARILVYALLPLDWNWDSYHHWQISYLTLNIGLGQGRMWDLNGSEYYWGVIPHLVQAFLLWLFSTASMTPFRIFNMILGSFNAYLVFLVGKNYSNIKVGTFAGMLFAVFPIAVVYDTIAMQETTALFFALLSVYFFSEHPVLSGVFLALAAQSRIEFWLVSIIFIVGFIIVERANQRVIPFISGWIPVTAVFCWFFATRTSNPVYPLYWSLYNTFGGWSEGGRGAPFFDLAVKWITTKLQVMPFKPTGIILLASGVLMIGVFIHMSLRRWSRYPLPLFFMSSLIVLGPIFVPYFALRQDLLLLMLRMSIPVAAIGSVLAMYLISAHASSGRARGFRSIHLEKIVILVTLASYLFIVPAYGQFQHNPADISKAADEGARYYEGGTVVSDYPILNYMIVTRWSLSPHQILSNHYSPAYYGETDPIEFARWLEGNNVTMWIYANEEAEQVWSALNSSYPDLLSHRLTMYDIRFYSVNQTRIKQITMNK